MSKHWEGFKQGRRKHLRRTTLRGHFLLKKKGAFSKIKRELLCSLQNLGGTYPQCPPVPTSMGS